MIRVGQNCIYTPYMTVYLVISLPKIPYIHRIYMVLANPNHDGWEAQTSTHIGARTHTHTNTHTHTHTHTRAHTHTPAQGSKIFCLHYVSMQTIDVPQSASMYRYLEKKVRCGMCEGNAKNKCCHEKNVVAVLCIRKQVRPVPCIHTLQAGIVCELNAHKKALDVYWVPIERHWMWIECPQEGIGCELSAHKKALDVNWVPTRRHWMWIECPQEGIGCELSAHKKALDVNWVPTRRHWMWIECPQEGIGCELSAHEKALDVNWVPIRRHWMWIGCPCTKA